MNFLGNPYMLQDVPPAHHYHHQPSPPLSIPSPMMMDKHRQTPHPMMPLSNPSPMSLNNASPMPLNNASPMALNNASPMPLNQTSPMPMNNSSPMPLNNSSPLPLTPPNSNPNMLLTPPHSNENVPPDETLQPQTILDKVMSEEGDINSKHQIMETTMQPLVENNSVQQQQMPQEPIQQQNGGFMPLYASEMQLPQREFDKAQDAKPRKVNTFF